MNDRFDLSWLFLFIRVGTTFFAALYILSRSRTPNLAQGEGTGWRGGTEMSMVLSRSQVMWVPGGWAGHLGPDHKEGGSLERPQRRTGEVWARLRGGMAGMCAG